MNTDRKVVFSIINTVKNYSFIVNQQKCSKDKTSEALMVRNQLGLGLDVLGRLHVALPIITGVVYCV